MQKRGKVLRNADAGPGLLMVDGQQYPFSLHGMWKSDVPPRTGMVVDVQLGQDGKISAIYAIAESQLAKEQAEVVVAHKTVSASTPKMAARFGMPNLVAAGVLIIAWFFLAAVSIQNPLGKLDFTFWQMLGFLNSNNTFEAMMQGGHIQSSAGVYGFVALVTLAGPFFDYFWKNKRAALGGLLPLLFMAVVGLMIRRSLEGSFGGNASGPMGAAMKQTRDEAMTAVSLGFGTYLSALISFYFAAIAGRHFLAAKTAKEPEQESVRGAAA
jgi:hypothetical protein